jgi:hypothetical protein
MQIATPLCIRCGWPKPPAPCLQQAIGALQERGMSETQSIAALTREPTNQAYLLSTLDFFWISGWMYSP